MSESIERPRRRKLLWGSAVVLLMVVAAAWSLSATAGRVSPGPDVTVIYLPSVSNNGAVGGIRGYAVGTTSCNVGNEPVWWCNDAGDTFCNTNQHPVIAQNLYRLKDGRFEQIGMSWLKHGFLSTNSFDSACGSCTSPPHGGDQLGIGCTDAYGAGLNGSRPLGMRSEVDGTTGDFPYPYTTVGASGVAQWMQVKESEVDPTNNTGARYWVEGHYIAADDAEANNSLNNASYREVLVSGASFNLATTGSTIRELPAIAVWPTLDADVRLQHVDFGSPIIQRFDVARRATVEGPLYHYEYAIHNMNSERAAQSFTIQFPPGTAITNTGFHDIDHHSGEPYDTADWTVNVDSVAGTVTWSTDTFATNNNANALRWGTMFSFWFDADGTPSTHTLALFKPGTPTSVDFSFGDVGGASVYLDGFESGDFSGWSSFVSDF